MDVNYDTGQKDHTWEEIKAQLDSFNERTQWSIIRGLLAGKHLDLEWMLVEFLEHYEEHEAVDESVINMQSEFMDKWKEFQTITKHDDYSKPDMDLDFSDLRGDLHSFNEERNDLLHGILVKQDDHYEIQGINRDKKKVTQDDFIELLEEFYELRGRMLYLLDYERKREAMRS